MAQWLDTAGNVISAHGGGFLQKDGYFYWFGKSQREELVSCYVLGSGELGVSQRCGHYGYPPN